jgi:DNA-binding response OmpR family regulator
MKAKGDSTVERTKNTLLPARAALSLLFVEPDRASIDHLIPMFQRHRVAVVGTAQQALQALGADRVDVLVTELNLPDVSGVDLINRVRTSPATRHILLMVLTHRASIASQVAALQAGADDYLLKPIGAEEFALHVRRVLLFRQLTLRWG